LRTNIFNYNENIRKTSGSILRRKYFLTQLIRNFSKLTITPITGTFNNIVSGYENDKLKIELYNYFKSFNDKWVGGNSIGQRLLLEEFLFFDKANKDIGDELFLNLSKIISLGKQDFDKTNLYGIISLLIKDTGVDMRPMPAYINFYGNNAKVKIKLHHRKKLLMIYLVCSWMLIIRILHLKSYYN
jgi:DNA-binding CsgD family transcriptional regulator